MWTVQQNIAWLERTILRNIERLDDPLYNRGEIEKFIERLYKKLEVERAKN